MGIINAELALKDLETVEKRLISLAAEARSGKKDAAAAVSIFQNIKEALMAGEPIYEYANEPEVRPLQLLTMKRQICLLNGRPEDVPEELVAELSKKGVAYVVADVADEMRAEEALHRLIQEAYTTLNLISFFTTGEEETRAWTIRRGIKAPEAAGTIHGDFESKFIRAETVSCDDLLDAGGWTQAKAKGKMRLEGKEYIVTDGDVMVIRHG
jgi:ribosome-binding ATPase YchF (GTP1/OBG family)